MDGSTSGRFVSGLHWERDAERPAQTVLSLKTIDAWALRGGKRIERLQRAAGPAAHLQLVDRGSLTPRLLITGKAAAVQEAHENVLRVLGEGDSELIVSLHGADVDRLQRGGCALLADLEERSGCRLIIDGKRSVAVGGRRRVRLLGPQQAQAMAVHLLAGLCEDAVLPAATLATLEGRLAFDPLVRSPCIELTENDTVARRMANSSASLPSHCVCACSGRLACGTRGAQVRLRVRTLDPVVRRGATRLAVTALRPKPPAPASLQFGPEVSWAFWRGLARGPDARPEPLRRGDLDASLLVGDEFVVFVARKKCEISVFRWRAASEADIVIDEEDEAQSPSPDAEVDKRITERSVASATKVEGSQLSDEAQEPSEEKEVKVAENGGYWVRIAQWCPSTAPDPESGLYLLVELSGRVQELELLPLGEGVPEELLVMESDVPEELELENAGIPQMAGDAYELAEKEPVAGESAIRPTSDADLGLQTHEPKADAEEGPVPEGPAAESVVNGVGDGENATVEEAGVEKAAEEEVGAEKASDEEVAVQESVREEAGAEDAGAPHAVT